jgi:hypothetical protein
VVGDGVSRRLSFLRLTAHRLGLSTPWSGFVRAGWRRSLSLPAPVAGSLFRRSPTVRPIFTESNVQRLHDAHLARHAARMEDARIRQQLRPDHPPSLRQPKRALLRPHRSRI